MPRSALFAAISAVTSAAGLITAATAARAVVPEYKMAQMKIPPRVEMKAYPFPLSDVRLLDGPFKHAMGLDEAYLLSLEPDRLLSRFREYAGLKPKAEKYGGWESEGISGHSLGHYLSACSLMYASTGDTRFKQRVDYCVSELALVQAANGDGFAGGMPNGKEVFAEIERGDIRSSGFDLNGSWVPWYNIHKTMAGLIDATLECRNEQATHVLVKLADWAIHVTRNLNDEQWQKMLDCEHGGMNDALADTYALTGDARYLALAGKFYHRRVLDPLSKREDALTGLHANTQIPKVIGMAREYELTGDAKDQTIASFFWHTVTEERSYVTGGNSDAEHFSPKEHLSEYLDASTTETCNTYNMLKLTRHLFCWDPRPEYADYYERALYNHILGSQNPKTGRMCYFIPLETGLQKAYNDPFESFACCVGTGMENHAKYGDSIYFHDAGSRLYVNLFIASELRWPEKGVRVRQETTFPETQTSRLVFTCAKPEALGVCIRRPAWAGEGYTVAVNGEPVPNLSKPASYITVERTWNTGDVVTIELPMKVHTEGFRDNPNRLAVMYGPLVMSAPVDKSHAYPVILTSNGAIAPHVLPVKGEALEFTGARDTFKAADGSAGVSLIPFYEMHDRPYAVYWDVFSRAGWDEQKRKYADEQARRREVEARTIDEMRPGEMQPERDHHFQGEKTTTGEFNGRKYRDAVDGGWFSFDMKVDAVQPADLLCTYWGSDRSKREFDILVDGQQIGTQVLEDTKPNVFFDVTYPIPAALTTGKATVTVTFRAHPGMMAGGLYGCRVVRRAG